MTRELVAEPVLAADARLAEGPRWVGDHLLWVDILGKAVHRFDPATGADTAVDVGRHVGAVGPAGGGALVAAVREGFVLLGPDGGERALDPLLADTPGLRFNDGRVDRAGRFWAGTLAYDEVPGQAALYRLDPDGAPATPVVEGLGLSNGIDWSPDDRRMYLVDTLADRIDVFYFDLGDGVLSDRRTFLHTPGPGHPDGLAVDADGAVWIAYWDGGRVERRTPDGDLDTVVRVPGARHVTAVGFGGPDLDVLYITTARGEPAGGSLFAVRTGSVGQPTASFGARW